MIKSGASAAAGTTLAAGAAVEGSSLFRKFFGYKTAAAAEALDGSQHLSSSSSIEPIVTPLQYISTTSSGSKGNLSEKLVDRESHGAASAPVFLSSIVSTPTKSSETIPLPAALRDLANIGRSASIIRSSNEASSSTVTIQRSSSSDDYEFDTVVVTTTVTYTTYTTTYDDDTEPTITVVKTTTVTTDGESVVTEEIVSSESVSGTPAVSSDALVYSSSTADISSGISKSIDSTATSQAIGTQDATKDMAMKSYNFTVGTALAKESDEILSARSQNIFEFEQRKQSNLAHAKLMQLESSQKQEAHAFEKAHLLKETLDREEAERRDKETLTRMFEERSRVEMLERQGSVLSEFERQKAEAQHAAEAERRAFTLAQEQEAFAKLELAKKLKEEDAKRRRKIEGERLRNEESLREERMRKQKEALERFEEDQRLKKMSASDRKEYLLKKEASLNAQLERTRHDAEAALFAEKAYKEAEAEAAAAAEKAYKEAEAEAAAAAEKAYKEAEAEAAAAAIEAENTRLQAEALAEYERIHRQLESAPAESLPLLPPAAPVIMEDVVSLSRSVDATPRPTSAVSGIAPQTLVAAASVSPVSYGSGPISRLTHTTTTTNSHSAKDSLDSTAVALADARGSVDQISMPSFAHHEVLEQQPYSTDIGMSVMNATAPVTHRQIDQVDMYSPDYTNAGRNTYESTSATVAHPSPETVTTVTVVDTTDKSSSKCACIIL
ncbi:hypothetical protein BASA60_000446 [Batrachochytrium salamandrivorans]|nr:hypothetical protein BASA60_000446 [Batrachochytrium salamandrivorans]